MTFHNDDKNDAKEEQKHAELPDTVTCQSKLLGLPVRYTQESINLFARGRERKDDRRPCDLIVMSEVPVPTDLVFNPGVERAYVRVINTDKKLDALYFIDRTGDRFELVKDAADKEDKATTNFLQEFDRTCGQKTQLLTAKILDELFNNKICRQHNPYRYRGQGYPYLAWKGFDEKNNPVLWVSLVAGFNKDDGSARTDNKDKPFEYSVTSDRQRLGGNTGVIHLKARDALIKRCQDADIPPCQRFTKDIPEDEICAGGIFKGDSEDLLAESRNASGNFNAKSIQYNEELLLCHNFLNFWLEDEEKISTESSEKTIDSYYQKIEKNEFEKNQRFYIQRHLPRQLFRAITEAALKDLEKDGIYKTVISVTADPARLAEQVWWEKYKDNPVIKNTELMATIVLLTGFGPAMRDKYVKHGWRKQIPEDNLIERALFYFKKNGGTLDLLDKVFNFQGSSHTALTHAANSGNLSAVLALLSAGASPDKRTPEGCTALDYAKKGDHKKIVDALLIIKNIQSQENIFPMLKAFVARTDAYKELKNTCYSADFDSQFEQIKDLDELVKNLFDAIHNYKPKPHGPRYEERKEQIKLIQQEINKSYKSVLSDPDTVSNLMTYVRNVSFDINVDQRVSGTLSKVTFGLFSSKSDLASDLDQALKRYEVASRESKGVRSSPSL